MDQDVEVSATCRKIRHHSGCIPHGGGSPGGAAPDVPWINLTRRTNGAGSAILITKDDRSRNLLTDLKKINGKDCAFRPLGNQAKKAYIMMGVTTCVTEELLLQDKEVIEAARMTKWNTEKQQAEPTNLVRIVLVGKQHPVRFTRRYGSFRLRPFVSRPLQCFNCQKFGHQVLRGTTRIGPVQGQRDSYTEVRKLRTGACRHQSPLPKDAGSREQSEIADKVSTTKQANRIRAPIPLKNAWTALAVQEVGRQPSTQQTTTIRDQWR